MAVLINNVSDQRYIAIEGTYKICDFIGCKNSRPTVHQEWMKRNLTMMEYLITWIYPLFVALRVFFIYLSLVMKQISPLREIVGIFVYAICGNIRWLKDTTREFMLFPDLFHQEVQFISLLVKISIYLLLLVWPFA